MAGPVPPVFSVPMPHRPLRRRILDGMTSSSGRRPKHLPSSPFKPAVEPVVEVFEVGDRVTHEGLIFEVREVDGRGVASCLVTAAGEPSERPPGGHGA